MAMRKTKPTSPGRRFATYQLREEVTGRRPDKPLTKGMTQVRRPQHQRPHHRAPPRRRRQAPLPRDRLQAHQGRRPGQGRDDRVRPEPHRYIALLHYADGDKATSWRRRALDVGDDRRVRRPGADIRPGNALPLRAIPTGTVVHNVEINPGQGGKLGRSAGTSIQLVGEGRRMVTLRLPSCEMRMVRADCRATIGTPLQRRAPERQDRQGRPQPPQGQAPADPRRRHEPGRPPARRWRGAQDARWPPGHAVGQADARLPHAQEGQGSDALIVRGRSAARRRGS